MNWLKKLSPTRREASGLEWTLWRKLPLILLAGTALPLMVLGVVHLLTDPEPSAQQARWLQLADSVVGGVIVFHWTMVLTLGIGCVIVIVMKGPGYVADGYLVSHSDKPREVCETDEDAAMARASALNGRTE